MFKFFFPALLLITTITGHAQLRWINMDSTFGDLPASVHIYKTTDSLDGKPNIAWYAEADISDKKLEFAADTTLQRRLTPQQFHERNDQPILVVNSTFFSFATNQNLNVVIKDGKLVSYNIHSVAGKGKDTLTYRHPFGSALGISKKRKADIAWLYTDSLHKLPFALQTAWEPLKDSFPIPSLEYISYKTSVVLSPHKGKLYPLLRKWKMKTAVGGGPVLLQNGEIKITNEEELKFYGKAINDKHPRTAMGYTTGNKLIVLVVEGRNPGIADGVTLIQLAQIFKDLGCFEALNLDGGGSSCMLVNGKETIKPSDKKQRPVPAVFIIKRK
jgi:hypothetical protein